MSKRLSKEEFVSRANAIHKEFYDYSKFIYICAIIPGIIICPIHGEFMQRASSHLRGTGCPACGGTQKSNLDKFLLKANKIHNYKYDYHKFIYTNCDTKGIIICPTHGEFKQIPSAHLRGQGCLICSGKNKSNNKEFKIKADKIHHQKYDYSKFNYVNDYTKGIIICSIHGEFKQAPTFHLQRGGCPDCGGSKKLTQFKFEESANKKHNYFYIYSKSIYINNKTKIIIICPNHGEFEQLPSAHLRGQRCPTCSKHISISEINWLDSLNIFEKYRQFKIKINNKNIRVDGFDPKTNTVYEFYGDYWHGNPAVYNQDDKIHYGKTFGELYKKTMKREDLIKKSGYNVISIWESDWLNSILNE